MKRNNSDRGTGLTLILILIVALIVAYLAVSQFKKPRNSTAQPGTDFVQQAQDAVDALNDQMKRAAEP